MTRGVRHLFRRPPTAVVKSPRARLGLQQLEDRETPATFTVTTTGDSGAGSLRDAVAQANSTAGADTVIFQTGLGPVTLTTAQLSLTDTTGATTISGPSGGTQVVRRSTAGGTPFFRILGINSGVTAHLNHLTISDGSGGSGSADGVGIRNLGTLTLTSSTVTGNTSTVTTNGIGIYNAGGLTVTASTVSSNRGEPDLSSSGGGIYNTSAGTVTITSSTISNNRVLVAGGVGGVGGGIYNAGTMTVTSSSITQNDGSLSGGIWNGGTMTVASTSVSGNTVSSFLNSGGNGGGFHNTGTLTVTGSTISTNVVTANSANGRGGAIFSTGTLTVTNSTLSGNSAHGFGGGVRVNGGTATLTNVTVTGNRSDINGVGGETGGGLSVNGGTLTLNNTLVAGNFRGGGNTNRDNVNGAVVGTSANNLVGDGTNLTGITNGTNGNQIGTAASPIDPLLGVLKDNGGPTKTHALGQNSPALSKASASVANYSVYDQRGTARDLTSPDIGAYEVQHPLAPVGVPTTLALLYAPKPSATQNEAFVKGLYQSTLLRAPDPAGLANWLTALSGGMTRSQVANGFVNSTENRTNQVTFFYRYFLGREPDTGGLNNWVTALQSGTDEGSVMTGFILSAEFSANNTNAQFVNLMYYALLGRAADTAGFNDWVNRLNTGTSRADVVRDFLRSEEGLNRVVRSFFQAYLKRAADTGGLDTFRNQLLSGTTFGQVATQLLGGQEFFTNAGNNMT